MFIWFSIFIYFLIIDFFIFKQNWFVVILMLSTGGIIFLFYLLVKLIVGPKKTSPSLVTQEPQEIQQEKPKAEQSPSASIPVIKKDTPLNQTKTTISLPIVFFVIELFILIGLTLYLILG